MYLQTFVHKSDETDKIHKIYRCCVPMDDTFVFKTFAEQATRAINFGKYGTSKHSTKTGN